MADERQYSIREETCPFAIPEGLASVLRAFALETGSGGPELNELPAQVVWSIIDGDAAIVGHGWVNVHPGPSGDVRSYLNFAVYDAERGKGAARTALPQIEEVLRARGHQAIYAQVNSNKEATGRRTRWWLHGAGYTIVREDVHARRRDWSDGFLIERDSMPMTFVKVLLPDVVK